MKGGLSMKKTAAPDGQLELNFDAASPTETRPSNNSSPDNQPEPAPALFPPPESPWEDLGNRRPRKRGDD
jgi:hypothetical protein